MGQPFIELNKIVWQEAYKELQQFYLEVTAKRKSSSVYYSSLSNEERKQYWRLKNSEIIARNDYERSLNNDK